MVRSTEGEGDRVTSLYLHRADPITLTLDATRLDLSREAGEVFLLEPLLHDTPDPRGI
jgi:hypothetical protein